QQNADPADQQDAVVAKQIAEPRCSRRAGNETFRPGDGDRQPLRWRERARRQKGDAARKFLGPVRSALLALIAGVGAILQERGAGRQMNARDRLLNGKDPAVTGDVPVNLVKAVEMADLARGAIGDGILMRARSKQ